MIKKIWLTFLAALNILLEHSKLTISLTEFLKHSTSNKALISDGNNSCTASSIFNKVEADVLSSDQTGKDNDRLNRSIPVRDKFLRPLQDKGPLTL